MLSSPDFKYISNGDQLIEPVLSLPFPGILNDIECAEGFNVI